MNVFILVIQYFNRYGRVEVEPICFSSREKAMSEFEYRTNYEQQDGHFVDMIEDGFAAVRRTGNDGIVNVVYEVVGRKIN